MFDDVEKAMEAASSSGSLWDSDDAIASLRMERTITDESHEMMAKRLLAQAAPLAAGKIIHIAMHSSNDNTALAAARYITDQLFEGSSGTGKAVWEQVMAEVIDEVELHANASQG